MALTDSEILVLLETELSARFSDGTIEEKSVGGAGHARMFRKMPLEKVMAMRDEYAARVDRAGNSPLGAATNLDADSQASTSDDL